MAQQVMLVYRGGKIVGPVSVQDVFRRYRQKTRSEIDFVIVREKGWLPVDIFLQWAKTTGEDVGELEPTQQTFRYVVATHVPWLWLLLLGVAMVGGVGLFWWFTHG